MSIQKKKASSELLPYGLCFPSHTIDQVHNTTYEFPPMGLKANQKAAGFFHNCVATFASVLAIFVCQLDTS